MEPIARLVFYLFIKMWENLYQKPYQTWQTAVKTFKNIKILQQEHTKRDKCDGFLDEYCFLKTI